MWARAWTTYLGTVQNQLQVDLNSENSDCDSVSAPPPEALISHIPQIQER